MFCSPALDEAAVAVNDAIKADLFAGYGLVVENDLDFLDTSTISSYGQAVHCPGDVPCIVGMSDQVDI